VDALSPARVAPTSLGQSIDASRHGDAIVSVHAAMPRWHSA